MRRHKVAGVTSIVGNRQPEVGVLRWAPAAEVIPIGSSATQLQIAREAPQ